MSAQNLAYWISPKGDTLKPEMYHIGAVIGNPKKFGETHDTIKKTFDSHGEPVTKNAEGSARNEIMERVMKRGFIRIRKHNLRRSQNWVIELYDMSNKKANYIANWAKRMIDDKIAKDIYADVTITDLRILRGVKKNLQGLSKALMESKIVNGMTTYITSLIKLSEIDTITTKIDMYLK
jgi:hypothetical protein